MRVRGFTQDDAHIFCTEDQIQSEVSTFIDLLHEVYADFGFNEIIVKLSTRPEYAGLAISTTLAPTVGGLQAGKKQMFFSIVV